MPHCSSNINSLADFFMRWRENPLGFALTGLKSLASGLVWFYRENFYYKEKGLWLKGVKCVFVVTWDPSHTISF